VIRAGSLSSNGKCWNSRKETDVKTFKSMKNIIAALLIFLVAASAAAQTTNHLNLEDGLAIEGYDPVAYFALNKSVKGMKELRYQHNGATYYFSSSANRDAFMKDPMSYEPQYGGWCAYAMGASGEKVEIDPETFKVANGKLYLFYNAYFNNTLPKWNKDEVNLKIKADKNWKAITNK
jgi:YHS domain-containing protein